MDKKIRAEVAMGIIIIVAIIVGGAIYFANEYPKI